MKRFSTDAVKLPVNINFANINTYADIATKTGSPIYKPNTRLTLDVKQNINVNIWVIRNNIRRAGKFDDFEVIFWQDTLTGEWIYDIFNITCDPSDVALQSMKNPNGTAIIAYGFHKGKWELGFHKQREDHPALVQRKPIFVYRDNNKDNIVDLPDLKGITTKEINCNNHAPSVIVNNTITDLYNLTLQEEQDESSRTIKYYAEGKYKFKGEVGLFGINNHRASRYNVLEDVGLYSEGCMVHQNPERYLKFINVLKASEKLYGKSFSITVVPIEEFL